MAFVLRIGKGLKRSCLTKSGLTGSLRKIGNRQMGTRVGAKRMPMGNLLSVLKGANNNKFKQSLLFRNGLMSGGNINVGSRGYHNNVFSKTRMFGAHPPLAKQCMFPMCVTSVLKANNHSGAGPAGSGARKETLKAAKKKRTNTQYLAGITNFTFVRDQKSGKRSGIFNKTENLTFANEWVKKRLSQSKIKSVNDVTSEVVLALRDLTESDDIVRMLIERSFDEAGESLNDPAINNLDSLLIALEDNLTYAPVADITVDSGGNYVDNSVTTPLALIYGPLAMTESGEALSYNPSMNMWWKQYLTEWQKYLDSEASKNVLEVWLSEPAYSYLGLHEYVGQNVDDYACWNDFFVRQLDFDAGVRPVDSPGDNSCVVSAVDAAVWHAEEGEEVSTNDTFWIKEQPYDLKTLLRNDETLINRYSGGTMLQSVLFPDDYHRWLAPVSGTVSSVNIVGTTYWTNINHTLATDTSDLQAWTGSVPYMSHLNVRSMIEIDTTNDSAGNIGKVLFMAVGLNEISTLQNEVSEGSKVIKGETELGKFLYGGSTVIYLFEPGKINSWTITKPSNSTDPDWNPMTDDTYQPVQVGNQIFTANIV